LDPTEDLDLGRYEYAIIIEMEDYPSTLFSTDYPSVVREEKLFEVKINPCLVSTLEVASYFEKVEYIVGNRQKSIAYTFGQEPCDYLGTYTIKDEDGSDAPDFINQLERYPIFDIYTESEDHVGNYTLEITVVLDNVALFADLDPAMDDYISDVNDPLDSQPSLVYTATFEFDLEVFPPESEYEEPDNTPPYLLPPPTD
jgi:hypothetical protein